MLTAPRLTLLLAVIATPALAGRSKMLEIKGAPKTPAAVAEAISKAGKDANRRTGLSLVLDELLRSKPELNDPALYDQLAGTLFNDVLDKMAEPTDAFSTDYGSDKFNPRADLFFRETVKVRPGRTTKEFRRRYTKKAQGKNIDRGYRNQPLTVDFATAASDDEFQQWTDVKSWGVVLHAAHVDTAGGIARIGCTFISNGSKDVPGGRFERPSWVAFYKQPKPGVGSFQLLAIEPVTATDWRLQPINLVPPKVEPNELAKKLYLAVWMEQVRALPARPAFGAQEEALFNLQYDTAEKFEASQVAWLDPYRDSDSPMVRAAAELKLAALGGPWRADSAYIISRGVKHPVVRARLEELLKKAPAGWTPPPLPPGFKDEAAAAADAGTKDAGVTAMKVDAGR